MRSLIAFSILLAVGICLASCEKEEEIHNTDTQVGHSTVTFFPTFTMEGEKYLSLVKGENYTEPGVSAKEGTADLPVTVSGTVDTNTPGVYDITYSATNKDNFSASVTRTVAVLPAAEQAGVDISGQYEYVANTSYTSTIQKLGPGFYLVNNVWGSAPIPSYILTTDGHSLLLPLNSLSGYGPVQGTGTLSDAGNLTYSVDLLDYGFIGTVRNWKKQ